MDYDKTCQILLLGDSSVGKTSLITRYTNGTFGGHYIATVGIEHYTKQETINNLKICVKVWDTAGQERFRAITPNILRNAEGIVLVYDVTNTESFENLKFWINSIKTNFGENNGVLPIITIGNKIDMEDMREINKDEAKKFAKENNYKYFETSAKTGEGVDEAFIEIVNQVISKSDTEEEKKEENNSMKLEKTKGDNQKKKGCC